MLSMPTGWADGRGGMCARDNTVKSQDYITSMADELNTSLEHWMYDPDREKPKYSDRKLFQGSFVHHRPHRK
jgi:hypothetical protein